MIELYKLHWSHYVEKVRWALDFKQLPWRGIEVACDVTRVYGGQRPTQHTLDSPSPSPIPTTRSGRKSA